MRINRRRSIAALALAPLVFGGPALAASNPGTAQVFIKCGVVLTDNAGKQFQAPRCDDINSGKDGWVDGRLDWYSANQLVFQESGPFFVLHDGSRGEVQVFLDGNGDKATFQRTYVDPATSIFTQPDVQWQLFSKRHSKQAPQLVASQPYVPLGSALWAMHSEDGAAAAVDVAGEIARARAAEGALRAALAGEAQARAAAVTAETLARSTGDASLQAALAAEIARAEGAEAAVAADVTTEAAARAAADSALGAALDAEIAARKAGDGATLAAANAYTDAQVAAAVAAAQAADANLHAALGAEVARATGAEVGLQDHVDAETARAGAAEASLLASLNMEIAGRNQGDADTLATANTYTLAEVGAEAAARAAADAAQIAELHGEVARALGAEATLGASIDNERAARQAVDGVLNAMLNFEVARAAGVEATLQVAINAEGATRLAADAALQAALGNEGATRLAADVALQAEIDAINDAGNGILAQGRAYTNTQVMAEGAARVAADSALATALAAEVGRATGSEAALGNRVDAETAARIAADMALDGALAAEVARATAGENVLGNKVSAETARAASAEAVLANQLGAEVARAEAAEGALATNLAAEAAARIAADNAIVTNLNVEVARAKAAEATLNTNLNGEVARAAAAEAALTGDLTAEVARATAAEATLTGSLNGEVARATAAEATLMGNLNGEVARATAAEATLTGNLNTEVARAQAAEAGLAKVDLSNLSNVKVNTSVLPGATNSINLGSGAKTWKTLFVTNNSSATAGVGFQPSGGGTQTLLQAAPATNNRTITLPDANGTVAVSASGNIALDGAGNISFAGVLPVANGGTNNNAFNNGKFVAYDGAKLASTAFDASSFAPANASVTINTSGGLTGGGNLTLGGTLTLGATTGGDLAGSLAAASVIAIRGFGVSAAAPANGQVLTWNGAQWAPAAPSGSITGNGSAHTLTKWTGNSTIGNSSISDDGAIVSTNEALAAASITAATHCVGNDCRSSWNNQDANSVNPMPRTCAAGLIAIATGAYTWKCGLVCSYGSGDCNANANDGCEIALATDKNNCGACGSSCSGNNIANPGCSNFACNGACNAGFADCNSNKLTDGCEINLNTDPNNCGNCGNVCNTGVCVGGACQFPIGAPEAPMVVSGGLNCTTAFSNTARKVGLDAIHRVYVAMICGGTAYFAASIDGGQTYSAPRVLGLGQVAELTIAGGPGQTAYAAGLTGGNVSFVVTSDGGASWSAPAVLGALSSTVAIGTYQNNVYVSGNGGSGVTVYRNANRGQGGWASKSTVQSVAYGKAVVNPGTGNIYAGSDTPSLYVTTSVDGGQTFSAALNPPGTSYYSDWTLGGSYIWSVGSSLGGGTGIAASRIPLANTATSTQVTGLLDTVNTMQRAIDADPAGNAYVVNQNPNGNGSILLYRALANANSFDAPKSFGANGSYPGVAALPTSVGAVVVYTSGTQVLATVQTY